MLVRIPLPQRSALVLREDAEPEHLNETNILAIESYKIGVMQMLFLEAMVLSIFHQASVVAWQS